MQFTVAKRVWLALQVWNEQDPNGETLAFVVRTGLCTTMGLMLRRVMAPLNISAVPFAKVSLAPHLVLHPTAEIHLHGFLGCVTCPVCQGMPSSACSAAPS